MARVLVAANSTWYLQNFRSALIGWLVREGHEVTTVSPDLIGFRVGERLLPHRTCAMDRSGSNPFKEILSVVRLAMILIQERTEVFLGFTIKPNIYGSGLCRFLKIPSVPDVSGLGTAFLGGSALKRTVVVLYRFAFARVNTVLFENPDDQNLFVLENIIQKAQARVVPGSGINLAAFPSSPLPECAHFLMIARLLGDKGVREYVGAARRLKGKLPSARFSLLGDLDRHNRTAISQGELNQWVRDGDVEYLGSTTDVRPFIQRSSVVVLPSYREGLPRTLLEGAAMGRPLVATDVPGCRQVVRHGQTGFLCEPRNVNSLADAMDRMASASHEERSRMGQGARSMVEEEFNESLVIGAYAEVLSGLRF